MDEAEVISIAGWTVTPAQHEAALAAIAAPAFSPTDVGRALEVAGLEPGRARMVVANDIIQRARFLGKIVQSQSNEWVAADVSN